MYRHLLITLFLTLPSLARAADVDWKWYGGTAASDTGVDTDCFYEEKGIIRDASEKVRVWTKCLVRKELEDLENGEADKKPYSHAFIDMSASRLAHYYLPPIFRIVHMKNTNDVLNIIMDETLADVGDLRPRAELYYELDCRQRMLRELHISVGEQFSTDKPTEWQNITPEGNAANLRALLCLTR